MRIIINKILYFFFVSVIFTGFYSCENITTPANIGNIPQKIKTETKWKVNPLDNSKIERVRVREFDINGNIIVSESFGISGVITSKSVFTYNTLASREEKTIYDSNGGKLKNVIVEYTYNIDNKVTKKIESDSLGKVLSVQTFAYDEKGNLVKKLESIDSGIELSTNYDYIYNDLGNLVERKVIHNGNLANRDSLSYNQNNNSLDIVNLNPVGVIESITKYVYAKNGSVQSETESTPQGKILNKYVYEYVYFKK